MNLLDWIIVILLVLGAMGGLRQGLIRSVFGLVGLVVGLTVGAKFGGVLAAYLETQFHWPSRLAASLAPHLPLARAVASMPAQGTALPDVVQGLDLPSLMTNYLAASAQRMGALPPGTTVGQALATLVASALVSIACFFAILMVVEVLAAFLGGSISGALALTPLHIVDHLAGAVSGAVTTAVFLVLLIGGLGLLSSVPTFAFMQPALETSRFAPTFVWFFDHLVPKVPGWLGLS